MNVFITGATGWVGTVVVDEMLAAGHRVTGLARTDTKAATLAATGTTVVRATLDDLDQLSAQATHADAVIHTAFNHDFANFAASCEQDRLAIEALGAALEGSDRPLLVTSGVALLAKARTALESDVHTADPSFPRKSEEVAARLAERGVRTSIIRLSPSVHGLGDQGFLAILITLARQKGVSGYIGEGLNRWPGVHRSDAGRLYRLVLEHGATERAYHAVAEEGVAFRDIAEVIGRRLGLPVQSCEAQHFGWFARFAGADMRASSAVTRAVLDWRPTGPELIADLDQPGYFKLPQ